MNVIINDVCVNGSLHALQTRKKKDMSLQYFNPGKITHSKEWIKGCGS
jgi:predicted phosphodiesterase